MCIEICKSGVSTVLRKSKNDGHVETVFVSPWAVKPVLAALSYIGNQAAAKVVIGGNYVVRSTRSRKYATVKNTKAKETIFIPFSELGKTITELSKSIALSI